MRRTFLAFTVALLTATGCDYLDEGYDPTIRVVDVVLTQAPLTRANGEAWDEDGPADMVAEIQNIAGDPVVRSETYTDLASLPGEGLALNLSFEIRTGDTFALSLLDADLDAPEVMAYTETFTFEALDQNGGDTFLLADAAGTTQARLTIRRD